MNEFWSCTMIIHFFKVSIYSNCGHQWWMTLYSWLVVEFIGGFSVHWCFFLSFKDNIVSNQHWFCFLPQQIHWSPCSSRSTVRSMQRRRSFMINDANWARKTKSSSARGRSSNGWRENPRRWNTRSLPPWKKTLSIILNMLLKTRICELTL